MTPDTLLRLGITIGGLVLLAVLEALLPAKARVMPRLGRWITNLSLGGLSSLAVRLMGPVSVAGAATAADAAGAGIFNFVALPAWLTALAVIVLLDLGMWAQHLAMHKAPLLWRMHRVHHADRDLDVTSGLRFHPFEAAVSMLWKAGLVLALGAPVEAALAYEIALGAMSLFTHANLRLSGAADRVLRLVVVTPDMHGLHHSVIRTETDSNFGNILSVWDRLFRSYRAAPQDALVLGLPDWQDGRPARLPASLRMPFSRS